MYISGFKARIKAVGHIIACKLKYSTQWLRLLKKTYSDGTVLTPAGVYYSCSVALLWKVWASGYNSAGVRALVRRQQQPLQKEWLMLLSHIRCTDRISDGGAEAKIVHIYMHAQAHALTSIRAFLLDGGSIANGRTMLINWLTWGDRKSWRGPLNKHILKRGKFGWDGSRRGPCSIIIVDS